MAFNNGKSSIKETLHRFQFKPPQGFASWSKSATSDKYFVTFVAIWLAALLITLISVLFYFGSLPAQIPLFYSRVWGEQQLAPRAFIFLPLAGTLLLGLFDIATGITFHLQNRVMSYLLMGTASLVSILSAITVINIIRLFI